LYSFLLFAVEIGSGETTAFIRHWFSAGVSTVPGNPQTLSISSICFTDMKLRSHWPSVTPSARVLVSSPVHVILRVEAAFASTSMPKTSTKMQMNGKRFGIATYKNGRYDMPDFTGMGV
jgi:hypothetical protein